MQQGFVIRGNPETSKKIAVTLLQKPPEPNENELREAVEILRREGPFKEHLLSQCLVPYAPMPPLAHDPANPANRLVAVGLRPSFQCGARHEIVGVNLSTRQIVRYGIGYPPAATTTGMATLATETLCGYPDAGQASNPGSGINSATVTVRSATNEILWQFVVIRPEDSSAVRGSGVELSNVSYKGKKVLGRAHVPILNVKYNGDACGPFRDWLNQENQFQRPTSGCTQLAPGIMQCQSAPSTIFTSGNDRGNFNGVVIYPNGDETVLVSEMEVGWYRYVMIWRFAADGKIRPRFQLSAVESSCVCLSHVHHEYWRFDFSLGSSAADSFFTYNNGAWQQVTQEAKLYRNGSSPYQVRGNNGRRYTITPGLDDGTALNDAYGKGDLWVLQYHSDQIDDGQAIPDDKSVGLNKLVNGEDVRNKNIVVWYGGHARHDPNSSVHVVGPTLAPAAGY